MLVNDIVTVNEYKRFHTEINYCEAVILSDGRITDAIPSHISKLIELSGKTYDEINELMPNSASPIEWLVNYTGVVSLWYEHFKYYNITDEQLSTIQQLIKAGILCNCICGKECNEMLRCKAIDDYYRGDAKELIVYDDNSILVSEDRVVDYKKIRDLF